jgi:hypothetical protein
MMGRLKPSAKPPVIGGAAFPSPSTSPTSVLRRGAVPLASAGMAEPYEQNTQQSPGFGLRRCPQPLQS